MKLKQASLPSLLTVVALFLLYQFIPSNGNVGFSFFIYGICMVHMIWALLNKWFRKVTFSRSVHVCNLAMLTISCFTLNQEIQLFAPFTPWVNAILIALFLVLLLHEYVEIKAQAWHFVYAFILTVGLAVTIYFNIVLLPIFHIGLLGMIVFGLGLHVFIPSILAITLIYFIVQRKAERSVLFGLVAGILFTVGSIAFVFYKIQEANKIVEKVNFNYVTNEENNLPKWVYVAEQIPVNRWTEMVIMGDFKYELFSEWFMDRGMNMGNGLSEKGIHDPFLNMAKLFGIHHIDLSDEERLSILKSNFNQRHQTTRKLWSGEHLVTSQCITDVKLYPAYRLAYTQKTLMIKNTMEESWRNEEALYTFQLPNDAVVTSMSLWVEGQERKSYLTTKEKADSAYVEIVGVQNRDPALLHWQEGNRVSVTVFPCNSKEIRMLKVGYTSPLKLQQEKLLYEDIFIEGPSFEHCKQDVLVAFEGEALSIEAKQLKLEQGINNQESHFNGDRSWLLQIPIVPLAKQQFSFNKQTFSVEENATVSVPKQIEHLVLDINATWTPNEFSSIMELSPTKKIWVSLDQQNLVEVNQQNKDKIWQTLSQRNFNLVPMYRIQANNMILITKEIAGSPSYKELGKTAYAKQLAHSLLTSQQPILCYNIAPWIHDQFYTTLHDFNYIYLEHSSLEQAIQAVKENKFPQTTSEENKVCIEDANMCIVKQDSTTNNLAGAPDHLMRLYNYTKTLQKAGKYYVENKNDTLLKECVAMSNEAFIVTPVSSLIVLETDKDYEQFGIDQNKNSLLNATKKGKGAVPEPHEWVLIGLGLLTMLVLIAKQKGLI